MKKNAACPPLPSRTRKKRRLVNPETLPAPTLDGSCFVVSSAERARLEVQLGLTSMGLLRALLSRALSRSVCPISHFRCGAAGLGSSGAIYLGTNLEFNAAGRPLSETVHAEQFVTASAVSHGEASLTAIAVTAMPCGHCRQFLQELPAAAAMRIVVPKCSSSSSSSSISDDGDAVQYDGTLGTLLPHAFGPTSLGKGCVDAAVRTPLALVADDDAPSSALIAAALAAAERSHAPYSSGQAGVALRTRDGTLFVGGVIESAAFNPTLGPMQAALIAMHSRGVAWSDVVEGALVEVETGGRGHALRFADSTRALFAAVAARDSRFAVHAAEVTVEAV